MKTGEIMLWDKNKPLPNGWNLVHNLSDTHHGKYAVMIEREAQGEHQNTEQNSDCWGEKADFKRKSEFYIPRARKAIKSDSDAFTGK